MRGLVGVARAMAVGVLAVGVASCGARSGLFSLPDAIVDAGPPPLDATAGTTPDAAVEAGVPCVPGRFDLQRGLAQLIFVVDRSGSMQFSLAADEKPPPGEPTRWDALRDAIATAVTPLDGELAVGAKFFPEGFADAMSNQGCSILRGESVTPGTGNVQTLLDVFATSEPFGGTPTSEALRAGAELVKQNRGVARTLVLATDGAPNCNEALDPGTCVCTSTGAGCGLTGDAANCLDDNRAVATVREIAEVDRIPVFVLGIGGDSDTAFTRTLDRMALAGGRPRALLPRYYPAQSPVELGAALTSIRDSVARCTYLTPSSPEDPNAIRVEIDGIRVSRDTNRQNGWDWVDQEYGQLAFFGAACERASAAGASLAGVVSCRR